MASEESFVVLVHHRGSIKRKTRSGVKFTDKDPLCIVMNPTTSYDDLIRSVLMKLGLEGAKQVKKFFYRIPVTVLQDTVKYDCFTIGSDEDLQVMFLCRRQFPEVRTPELLAKLVDVVSSSGGSNRNTTTVATAAGSSSRPAVAYSSVPVYEPVGVPPVGVGDGLLGDAEEDDVEPDMIEDDSGDEVGATEPALAVGGSSSGTHQYPPHFSSLDLDVMR
ncbi:Putative mutator sub-class protein [Arachis hypogaea]|nr:Putative mutator sub-class protein [Arachis hypogaea]